MSFHIKILINELPDQRIEVVAVTNFGEAPLVVFSNREEFAKFAVTVEDFHRKLGPIKVEVPDAFRRAFPNEAS